MYNKMNKATQPKEMTGTSSKSSRFIWSWLARSKLCGLPNRLKAIGWNGEHRLEGFKLGDHVLVAADGEEHPSAAAHPFGDGLFPAFALVEEGGEKIAVPRRHNQQVKRFVSEPAVGQHTNVINNR